MTKNLFVPINPGPDLSLSGCSKLAANARANRRAYHRAEGPLGERYQFWQLELTIEGMS